MKIKMNQSAALSKLKKELKSLADPKQARILRKFFKTGKGEYGEGDVFLGIKAPQQRKIAGKYHCLGLREIKELLNSKVHEHRSAALFILVNKYKKADEKEKEKIFKFYLDNSQSINNWDLVDVSAPKIVGDYLLDEKDRRILYKLAKSKNLWQRRIAVLSTYTFIKNNQFGDIFKIAGILLNDEHDLIHKAVGWMLREAGNKNRKKEEEFLKKHLVRMPRTALRYAIEKFPEKKRKLYLTKKIHEI